ncbi:hypothetical protein A1OE_921 [Candidatus Endolissoclinum faulkneri L2]|uniref:Uncharacterized protein n=1 Tax=Candidatus Endolissoclinum faulkneri L2 TaxID=1193729 RepID=K7YRD4_9PROT|nr:hypothetical protein A1OE_921 [Candidatus Endolissoclinum faulkneri L2]
MRYRSNEIITLLLIKLLSLKIYCERKYMFIIGIKRNNFILKENY